jgi:hypothetical protein
VSRSSGSRRAAGCGLGALLALACFAGGCRHLAGLPPRLRPCPGPIRSTREIAGDFTRLERIRVRGDGVDESFGLVVQKIGERLVVLGTNAFGAKAFAVTQEGDMLEARSFVGPALSVPPENVLRDLHRAYFLAPAQIAASPRTATPTPDGAIRITAPSCGYESTLVLVSEQKATQPQ